MTKSNKNIKKPINQPKSTIAISKNKNIYTLIIIALCFVLYGNTISNDYSLDDKFVTSDNKVIQQGIKSIPKIFNSYYSEDFEQNYEYRPIVKVSYAIEYQLFKTNPHISHFINILLYIVTCLLLFSILKNLLKQYNVLFPFVITLIFAAHPIHTEVIASLKNRDEIFSFLFSLLSLKLFIKYIDQSKLYFLFIAIGCYLVALLSKLSSIPFLAVIPLVLYFFKDISLKKAFLLFGILFFIAYCTLIAPYFFLPPAKRDFIYFENPLFFEKGFGLRTATGFYSLLYYLKLLILPHPLVFYYGFDQIPMVRWSDIGAIFSFLFHTGILVFAFIKLKQRHILSFAIFYYLITISMFANIITPMVGIIGERFVYFASLGFCIALAYGIFAIFKQSPLNQTITSGVKSKIIIALIILMLPYTAKTITRNKDWKDELTLYSNDNQYLDRSAKANVILGTTLLNDVYLNINKTNDTKKHEDEAIRAVNCYKRAIEIYPDYLQAYNNLASVYLILYQQYDKAIPYLKKAIELKPNYVEALYNMGFSYERMNQPKEAIIYFEKLIKVKPDYIRGVNDLSSLYVREKSFQKAIDLNNALIKIKPNSEAPYINLGNCYLEQKDTIKTIQSWEKAVSINSSNSSLCMNLASYYKVRGDLKKAEIYYNKANKIK